MKKSITSLLVFFLLLLLSNLTFAQSSNSKDYDVNKANFWKQYLQYKENLKTNPLAPKPVDPSGLFRIDENNNFNAVDNSINVTDKNNQSSRSGPWINGSPDVVTAYTWSQTTGTYTSVVGTTLGTNANDDNIFTAIPIGFNFLYDGVTYSTIDVCANGYIRLGGAATTSSYPNVLSLQTQIFAGFNADLRANNTTSTLQYVTSGVAGSRVMTIQWASYGCYNAGWDGSDFSFQMKLYETANTLQLVFGPNPTVVNGALLTIQCGINTLTTDYNDRTTATDWTATTAGVSNTAASTFSAAIKPPNGQIWTWTPTPMTYTSSTTVQVQNGVNVPQNTNNNPIIQIQVVTGGGSGAITATSFSVGTNGSTNPVTDISNAKIYFTANSSSFATTNLFGTQASPNGTFSISGNQPLSLGTNYFWLTYDVPGSASVGNLLDAQCNTVTIGSPQVPTVTAPAGSRPISAPLLPLCGTITIPGTYSSLAACITDLNTVGVLCPTTVNIAAGYTETNFNQILTCPVNPPNSTNTLTFRKNGAGANPLLTAGVGTSLTTDGMMILNGVSYVTFDGIDLQENGANPDATTQMEWGYALLKQSGTLACQHDVIKNCTVTLNKSNANSVGIYTGNHLVGSTTALTVSSVNGTGSYNSFLSNTVQNCYMGYKIQGYASLTPFDYYDQGNEIGNTGALRSQVLNFGNGVTGLAAYGIYTVNQNLLKVHHTYVNSQGGADNISTLYGIYVSTATNASADIYNDTVTVKSASLVSSNLYGVAWECGTTGQGNTINVYNNVVTGCTYATNVAGIFRGFINSPSSSATATFTNFYNNTVSGNSIPGTGEFSGIYLGASTTTNMVQMNVYNNTVTGNTHSGTAGNMYMCYVNGSVQQKSFYNNTLTLNSNATSSGSTYGYYNFGVDYNESVHDNVIANNTGGSGLFDCIEATSGSGPTDKTVYNNTVNGNSGAGLVSGMVINFGQNVQVYKNNIYNLTSTNALGIAPAVSGITFSASTNLNCLIYNNFISELKAPNATSISSIYGMWLQAPGNLNVYYNTIYLNASSSSTTFGTAGLNYTGVGTLVPLLDLRNNIIVNSSTPGATGRTVALQRATTTLTNYNILSGNNCYWAGTPSAINLIHFDGTNSDQTLQAFKDRMGARDQSSFTEIPPFVNVGASPYDLHIQTGIGTQCEKGGQPLTAVTIDYDGTARNVTFPDVGADEFAGTINDIASPLIIYSPLGIGAVGTSRTVTNFAAITDPSGINTTAGTRPRIYYKKSTQGNVINDNTSGTDGWKWVEATGTTSPFSFNIDYTILFGGSVAAADIIQYFVVAQDLNGTPRVGNNAVGFAVQPTSVVLAAAQCPMVTTNTNTYTIGAGAPLTGVVTVGTLGGETYPSLTNAGGLFAAINAGTLSGNLTVNITSDLLVEAGTNSLLRWSETGVGGYTITIVPATGTLKTIAGTSATPLINLSGASRVTIDGRFGGSGSFLLFRNLSTAAADLQFVNDAQNNVVRNCIFESANTGTASGAIVIGTTTGPLGNDNNIITYNEIRNRTDVVAYYAQGIYCAGTVTTLPQYNNNCVISNNNIHDFFIDGGTQQGGITIVTGNSFFNIDSNSVYQTLPRTMTVTGALGFGIFISNSSPAAITGGFNVRKNYVGGGAPLCAGTPFTWTVSSTTQLLAFNGIRCVSGQIPNFVTDNVVSNFDLTANNTASNNFIFLGIGTGNGIWNIKRNTIGATTGNDAVKITLNTGGAGLNIIRGIYMGHFTVTAGWGGVIDSNRIGSITVGGSTTVNGAYLEPMGIGGTNFLVNNPSISYNVIGSTTTANSIRMTYPTALTNLRIMDCFAVSQTITVNANIFQNISDASTGASTLWSLFNGTPGNVTHVITNNLFSDISSNTSAGLGSTELIYLASISPNEVVSGNTMRNISLTNTAALSSGLVGFMTFTSNGISGTFSKNKIYGLNNVQTGAAPSVFGVYFNTGADWNVSNNMIALTNGEPLLNKVKNDLEQDNHVDVPYVDHAVYKVLPGYEAPLNYKGIQEKQEMPTEQLNNVDVPVIKSPVQNKSTEKNSVLTTNSAQLYGVYDATNGGTKSLLYNSIYIGGTNTGAANNSYCFLKGGAGNIILRNNLLYNNRTGLGSHYAIANDAVVPGTGWIPTASNYNAFVTADTTIVGSWGLVTKDINGWRTSSLGDNQSWSTKNTVITPANLFTSIATGDLTILSGNAAAWLVKGKGIALSNVNSDFNGNPRSTAINTGTTCIGASEFAAVPPGNPLALQSAAPSSGGTTDYTLYGRKIASITWGTGGVYPTSMNVNYFSGVNPPNLGNFTANYGNSYWTVNPGAGTFSGTTYNATFYFGDNETYTITSPSTNTILGKNDAGSTTWFTYGQGTNNLQTQLNWPALTVKVNGLSSFSNFALSDNAIPASPFLLIPINNATAVPVGITFVWSKSQNAATYRIQVATDSTFATGIVMNDSTVTDTTKLASGLVLNTNYWWRVRGKSGVGTGLYSSVFKFNTTPALLPPAPPVLSSPANLSTGQALAPLLIWFRSTNAATYRVQVATDAGFSTLIVNDSTVTDSTKSISGLNPLTNYWWRINAKNAAGTSAFSSAFTFKTIGPASLVTLINPANGATNQPINILFTWSKAVDLTSRPLVNKQKNTDLKNGDNVEVVSNYWYERVTDTVTNANLLRDTILTDTTKNVLGLNYTTTYYWRIKAKNQIGWGAFTWWNRFTTGAQPPAIVNLTVIPGGFYNSGTGTLNMRDTIRVYLVDSATCVKVDSSKIYLDSVTFSASPSFSIANTGSYYIFVTHRNHVVISSRLKQTVTRGATVSYNFVSDSSSTYGNNVIKVSTSPVRWAMIPGDANQDQFVDGLDQSIWILQNGLDGYLVTDFNGDSFIDGLDQSIWILFNGNSSFLPCAFPDYYTNPDSKKHVVIDNRNTKDIFKNNSNQDTRKGNK